MALSTTMPALLLSLMFHGASLAQSTCDTSALNTTIGSWPVTSTDTIFTIAEATGRGACDIARANRMSDAVLMVAGETLIIPAETCDPDDSTCIIASANYTATCVPGGLHTYNTRFNDTRATVAAKFRLSVDAITLMGNGTSSEDAVIETDLQLKIPQCSPSQCVVQPYKFTYGTYLDLAEEFNTTVGQIMAFNPTYNYSHEANPDEGPVISMPMNCVNLSGNVTVIS